jgi:hypothetical protein
MLLVLLEPEKSSMTLQEAMERAALGVEAFHAKQQLVVALGGCSTAREAALDKVRL